MQKASNQLYPSAIAYRLFQKNPEPEETVEVVDRLDEEEPKFSRIRCPLCLWQPNPSSLWGCDDCGEPEYYFNGCGTEWNTFDTRGLCPGCEHQWRWTVCLSCYEWSMHEEWYAKDEN